MKCILDILKNWCNPFWVKQPISLNNIFIRCTGASPVFRITGTGKVTITGGGVEQTYIDPSNESITFPVAGHVDITINGDISSFRASGPVEYFNIEDNAEILETLSSACSNYKSDLDSYNEQIMSDGYNKAVDETQDAIENENLKQKALSIISAIFRQKCYIENPALLEKTLSLVSQSERIINDTAVKTNHAWKK